EAGRSSKSRVPSTFASHVSSLARRASVVTSASVGEEGTRLQTPKELWVRRSGTAVERHPIIIIAHDDRPGAQNLICRYDDNVPLRRRHHYGIVRYYAYSCRLTALGRPARVSGGFRSRRGRLAGDRRRVGQRPCETE